MVRRFGLRAMIAVSVAIYVIFVLDRMVFGLVVALPVIGDGFAQNIALEALAVLLPLVIVAPLVLRGALSGSQAALCVALGFLAPYGVSILFHGVVVGRWVAEFAGVETLRPTSKLAVDLTTMACGVGGFLLVFHARRAAPAELSGIKTGA